MNENFKINNIDKWTVKPNEDGYTSPVCLAYAVAVIEKYKAYEQAKQEKEKAVDDLINRLSCTNCDRFGIDCGSCEAGDCD